MIPWVQLGTATIPGGREPLRLKQRGSEFSIMLGTNELMNSRLSGSEEALARLPCARIRERTNARVLIGGLGMGFTLRATLRELGADGSVTVTELVPEVVAWAKGPMSAVFAGSLDDPRVTVRVADVGDLIRAEDATYDAILLDVDNGPEGLSRPSNDALYGHAGLAAAHAALSPGGVLAVWSAGPDRAFTARLKRVGFQVDETRVRANAGRKGATHVIWLATKVG